MITNRQLIEDALGALGVLGEGESASDTQGALALRLLNAMLATWQEDGIELQYFEQPDLSANCPIPPWAVSGVRDSLAIYMAADFGAPVAEALVARAKSGVETITRHAVQAKMKPADMSHMPQGEAYRGYDIIKGH